MARFAQMWGLRIFMLLTLSGYVYVGVTMPSWMILIATVIVAVITAAVVNEKHSVD